MSYGDGGGYRSAEPSRGVNLRMVAGLVMAVIGIIVYMTRTQVNPVTGEKQHIAMSVSQEKAMGLQAAPQMAAKMGGAISPTDDIRARAVAAVGRMLVEKGDASQSDYADNFHFTLLDDNQTVNAFALPGGPVFITKALYDKLEWEAELAGVLGHEIGHVVGRHSAEQLAKSQLGQTLATAFAVGASGDQHGQQAAAVAAMVNQMSQLHFSRGDESRADQLGLKYMAEAEYDPSAMLKVMEILKGLRRGGPRARVHANSPAAREPDHRDQGYARARLSQRHPRQSQDGTKAAEINRNGEAPRRVARCWDDSDRGRCLFMNR